MARIRIPDEDPAKPKPARVKLRVEAAERVYAHHDPDRIGVVITPGEEVSGVRWIDGLSPKETYVSNKWLRKAKA